MEERKRWATLFQFVYTRETNVFKSDSNAGFDEEDEDKERKKRKRKRDDAEDDMVHIMDEMAPEKTLQSQISLAEINRKLAGVMYQP